MRALVRTGAFVLALAVSRGALAAPPETSPAIIEAARARVKEGIAMYGKKRYDRAHAAFLQAYALSKNTTLLINLGFTSLKLGHPLEAAGYFNRYLNEAKDATPEQRARVDKALSDARRALGAIEITAPEGAEITVDGEVAGRAPLAAPVDVLPGRHEVTSTTTAGTKTETVTVGLGAIARARLATPGRSAPPNAVLEPERGPSSPANAPPAPQTPEEPASAGIFAPPETTWPVYTMGAVGLVSFTTAIVLGGIGANAGHNVTNAEDALARNGKGPQSCAAPDPTIAATCSTLASGRRTSSDVKTPFAATLAVGAGATLFALGWYFFAPKAGAKEPSATTTTTTSTTVFTPLIGPHGEPGATLEVTF
jgi:hypothetical protein